MEIYEDSQFIERSLILHSTQWEAHSNKFLKQVRVLKKIMGLETNMIKK